MPEPERPAGNATILVVEDDPAVQDIVVETLQEFGYATVTRGEMRCWRRWNPVERHHGHRPAVPQRPGDAPGGMNGVELASAARAMQPDA